MNDSATTAAPERDHGTGSLTRGQRSALDQLRLFEAKYDPGTRAVIDALPFRPAWRCLELGAGAGSMARWLAGRATGGSVLAVDLDTGALEAGPAPRLAVRRADITGEDFAPGSFDLVLARATFEHLARPHDVLERAVRWLAPGGWLLVEDFYYMPPEDAPTHVGRTLLEGYVRRMREQGADLRWARGLPAALAGCGLEAVDARLTPAGPGQSPQDDALIGRRLRQEGEVLVTSGLVTARELADFIEALGRPGARDLTTVLVSAWGRKAPVA